VQRANCGKKSSMFRNITNGHGLKALVNNIMNLPVSKKGGKFLD
jgi:hypothetical protein